MTERDLERLATDYLALDGWRCLKTDPVSDRARGKGFGELGMADCLYLRYGFRCPQERISFHWTTEAPIEHLWIEWKRPGGKLRPHQARWIQAERARGALVLVCGLRFPCTFEGFTTWYAASGLARKNLSVGARK